MTRRKHPPPKVDPDDYGFDVAGKPYKVTTRELLMLFGLDTLTCALYMRGLKPFADRTGRIYEASYYRFLKILTPAQSPRGGPRLPEPTKKQMRRALDRLQEARLITVRVKANRSGTRALEIRVNAASDSSPSQSVGAGVGADLDRNRKPIGGITLFPW